MFVDAGGLKPNTWQRFERLGAAWEQAKLDLGDEPQGAVEDDPEVDDEIPALTIYRKREVNIETERKPKTRTTEITADEFYVAVLSNEAKVVLAKFKA